MLSLSRSPLVAGFGNKTGRLRSVIDPRVVVLVMSVKTVREDWGAPEIAPIVDETVQVSNFIGFLGILFTAGRRECDFEAGEVGV